MALFVEWLKAMSYWLIAAVGFLPSLLDLLGVSWLRDNVSSPESFAFVGLVVLLFGSFMAFRRVASQRDQAVGTVLSEAPQFKISAPVLPTVGADGLLLSSVYLVNRGKRPLNLRFFLEANSEVAHGAAKSVATYLREPFLPNPKDVKPGDNHAGFLAFNHTGSDPTPFLVEGVQLKVVDEQTPNFEIRIPLPTPNDGYQYPPLG